LVSCYAHVLGCNCHMHCRPYRPLQFSHIGHYYSATGTPYVFVRAIRRTKNDKILYRGSR